MAANIISHHQLKAIHKHQCTYKQRSAIYFRSKTSTYIMYKALTPEANYINTITYLDTICRLLYSYTSSCTISPHYTAHLFSEAAAFSIFKTDNNNKMNYELNITNIGHSYNMIKFPNVNFKKNCLSPIFLQMSITCY